MSRLLNPNIADRHVIRKEQVDRKRVYIWTVINIVTLVFLIVRPDLWNTPIWVIIILSKYILQSKKEIINEFKQEVTPKSILLILLIIILFVAIISILLFFLRSDIIVKPHHIFVRSVGILLLIIVIVIASRKLGTNITFK
jgi:hypothetical protein